MKKVVLMKWEEIGPLWQELYDKNTYATGYQSYEYLTKTKKGRSSIIRPFECKVLQEANFVLLIDNVVFAIAPLLVKRTKNEKTIYLRGHFSRAFYLDFIYRPDLFYDDFEFMMDSIKETLGNPRFNFAMISERSMTYEFLKRYLPLEPDIHPCVSIPISNGYDFWWKEIASSVRKDIRNAKKRLQEDNLNWEVKLYYGSCVGKKTEKQMLRLFSELFFIKNDTRIKSFERFIKPLLTLWRNMDPSIKILFNSKIGFHAVLYMDEKVAAYHSGVICNDGRIAVNIVASNRHYFKYNPGFLLIDSIIMDITSNNKCGAIPINEYDLSNGDLRYKYDCGGKKHNNYYFEN